MQLRIVSGDLKGRYLNLKAGSDTFRPTAQRIREAVASALAWRITGASVADLCAGSGAFGFEMLSRGASTVDFVENDSARAEAINTHARTFGVEPMCRIVAQNVQNFLADRRGGPYNIVFYDPPYADDSLASLIPDIASLVAKNGICVVEHGSRRDIASILAKETRWLIRTRLYGETAVSYLTSGDDAAGSGAI